MLVGASLRSEVYFPLIKKIKTLEIFMKNVILLFLFISSFSFQGLLQAAGKKIANPVHDGASKPGKILYVISPPRCGSTAFFRSLAEQGVFKTFFHEPTIALHNLKYKPVQTAKFYHKGVFPSFKILSNSLLEARSKGNVLVKDISFSSFEFLSSSPEIVANPNVHFVFLVRNPYDTISSYYKVFRGPTHALTGLVGFEQALNIYKLVKKMNPNKIQVVQTEEFFKKPSNHIFSIFSYAKIRLNPSVKFEWESLSKKVKQTIIKWHDQKNENFFSIMHKGALVSKGLKPLQTNVTADCDFNFGHINNLEKTKEGDLDFLRGLYFKVNRFYQDFLSFQNQEDGGVKPKRKRTKVKNSEEKSASSASDS